MLEELKRSVCEANLELPKRGLITYTWGNVSGIDRERGVIVIKPSGVAYDGMKPEDMVVVSLDGEIVEGNYRPSSDLETHLELYKQYSQIGGIVHTHSSMATAWAQACRPIPCYGTTHADYFHGPVPCARSLTQEEVEGSYEYNTGRVIIETLQNQNIEPLAVPGILCSFHGPFTWGKDEHEAVHNAVVLEELAKMALCTLSIQPDAAVAPQYLLDKHYYRKHGANAYYGQNQD